MAKVESTVFVRSLSSSLIHTFAVLPQGVGKHMLNYKHMCVYFYTNVYVHACAQSSLYPVSLGPEHFHKQDASDTLEFTSVDGDVHVMEASESPENVKVSV